MFTRQEKKEIRVDFWNRFTNETKNLKNKRGYSRQWMLHRTGIKGIDLKFYADQYCAKVILEVNITNEIKRNHAFELLGQIQSAFINQLKEEPVFEADIPMGKSTRVAQVYVQLYQVSIYREESWPDIFQFFIRKMKAMERVWREFGDFVKENLNNDENI